MADLSNLLGNVYSTDADTDLPETSSAHDEPSDEPEPLADGELGPEGEPGREAEQQLDEEQIAGDDRRAGGPDWASDDRLDAAFGNWTAGEMPDMERDARELIDADDSPVSDDAEGPTEVDPDDLPDVADQIEIQASSTAESAVGVKPHDLARVAARPAEKAVTHEVTHEVAHAVVDDRRWELTHDDILPRRRGGLAGLLRRG